MGYFAGLVRVHRDAGRVMARVYAPRSAVEVIKELDKWDRKWDPEVECWRVLDRLLVRLREEGYRCRVIATDSEPPPLELPRLGEIRGANWR